MGRFVRFVRSVVSLGALLTLAGCWWPVPGHDADRTGYNPGETALTPANVGDLEERWSRSFDGPLRESPVVSAAGVHVLTVTLGGGGTTLSTHAVDDGATRWAQPGPGGIGMGGPWVVGDRVAAGWHDMQVGGPSTADTPTYDVTTGAPRGSIGAGVIYAVRGDWVVTSQTVWSGPGPLGTQDFTHYRNLADPSQDYTVGPVGPRLQTLGDGYVYRPTNGSVHVGAIGAAGATRWETFIPGGQVSLPVLDADETTVYVTGEQGVYALDAATGAIRWSADLVPARFVPPSLAGDVLYVPTAGGELAALAADGCGAATCVSLWVGPGSGPAGSTAVGRQAAVAGGLVFTAWDDGSIHAYAAAGCGAASCPPLWSTTTGSTVTGGPVVAGGQLYVTTADFRLIAYSRP